MSQTRNHKSKKYFKLNENIHRWSPRRKGGCGKLRAKTNIWRDNGQKLSKFDQRYESTHPGISLSSKQGELKEIHTKIYYHETVEGQGKKPWKQQERSHTKKLQ